MVQKATPKMVDSKAIFCNSISFTCQYISSCKLQVTCFVDFLKLLSGCPAANFGPLLRGKPHPPNFNHCVSINIQPKGHQEPRSKIESPRLVECILGFEPGIFRSNHNASIYKVTLAKHQMICNLTVDDYPHFLCFQ